MRDYSISSKAGKESSPQFVPRQQDKETTATRQGKATPTAPIGFDFGKMPVIPPERQHPDLPLDLQMNMESSFGQDFSGVDIHRNSQQAQHMNALAYTQGESIHFAPGEFNPHSERGRNLIGHEFAHVVQQRSGVVQTTAVLGKGLAINDNQGLENEADTLGRKAVRGEAVDKYHSSNSENRGHSDHLSKGNNFVQFKLDSSFPEDAEEKLNIGNKSTIQKKENQSSSKGVVQMRGGAKVGELCINSNVVNEGLTEGHAWLSYEPVGGTKTTYGTWGNRTPIGLHRDIELADSPKVKRCTDIDSADYTKFQNFASNNNAWSYTNNCASFAGRGWRETTGESISYTNLLGIPNPSSLGKSISNLGGILPNAPNANNNGSSSF